MKWKVLLFIVFFSLACNASEKVNVTFLKDHDTTNVFRIKRMPLFANDCVPNILLTNIESNNTYLYWAGNSIRVSNNYRIIGNSGSDIVMKAGKTIVLKNNSAILKGNKYLARIEKCESFSTCPTAAECVIPKGISPNGDNLNDTFDLSAFCVREIKIFNRYGKIVYEAQNYKDEWHGQSDDKNLPSATYYYIVTLSTSEQLTGWVYVQH